MGSMQYVSNQPALSKIRRYDVEEIPQFFTEHRDHYAEFGFIKKIGFPRISKHCILKQI